MPAMWETWVLSLGWEDPLEKGKATHSGILPGESHGQRSLAGYSPWVTKKVKFTFMSYFPFCGTSVLSYKVKRKDFFLPLIAFGNSIVGEYLF